MPAARPSASPAGEPPTADLIRLLLAAELYDDALNELRHVQRTSGTSPVVEATIAWAYHRKGELRRAITLMRRAYPHFLAADQTLPREILQVIFPLTYWDLIRKHAAARDLDPYLVAALIAQESTFDPEIRSAANAWGLMQIVPATGRRLATLDRDSPIHDADADQSRDQRPPRHAVLLAPRRPVRRRLLRPRQLQRRREPRRPLEGGAARASTRTSSSTTSRSPRPRTTSSASSAPPKTTASSMARAAAARFPLKPLGTEEETSKFEFRTSKLSPLSTGPAHHFKDRHFAVVSDRPQVLHVRLQPLHDSAALRPGRSRSGRG